MPNPSNTRLTRKDATHRARPGASATAGTQDGIRKGWLWALIGLMAALAPVLGYLDRGIDLTDEGFYLLGYHRPNDVFLTLTHFQRLVAALVGHGAWPVAFYRVLALVLAVIPAAFFAVQARRARIDAPSAQPARDSLAIAAFAAIGSLLCYTAGPRSLSYNGLNNALMLIEAALAFMLAAPAAREPRPRRDAGLAALLGFCLAAHIVVKVTTAALMGGWIIWAILWLRANSSRRQFPPAASATAGAVAFAVLFFSIIVPFRDWWAGIAISNEMSQLHSPLSLIRSSLLPALKQLVFAGPVALVSIGLVMGGRRLSAAGRARAGSACMVFGCCLMLGAATLLGTMLGGFRRDVDGGTPFAMLLALGFVLWLVPLQRARSGSATGPVRLRHTRVLLLLLPLPFVAAAGTSNPLTLQILHHLAPWFALLWLLAEEAFAGPARSWGRLVVGTAAVVAIVQVAESQIALPYRIAGGMRAQRESFSPAIEAGRGLRVDADTKRLVEETQTVLVRNGFHPGDPVLFLYDLPGLVYLVDGRSPVLPWFFKESDPLTCRAIELARAELARSRVYVLARDGITPAVLECLVNAGVTGDVRDLGVLHSPYYGEIYIIGRLPAATSQP